MSNQSERQVVLGDVDPQRADREVTGMAGMQIHAEGAQIPDFKKKSYYSFKAEWDVIHGDLVVHFYLPKQAGNAHGEPRAVEKWMQYWLNRFPVHLSEEAKKAFKADYPRVFAKYTEETVSWFFKAQGFGLELLNPQAKLEQFFEQLDAVLKGPPPQA